MHNPSTFLTADDDGAIVEREGQEERGGREEI